MCDAHERRARERASERASKRQSRDATPTRVEGAALRGEGGVQVVVAWLGGGASAVHPEEIYRVALEEEAEDAMFYSEDGVYPAGQPQLDFALLCVACFACLFARLGSGGREGSELVTQRWRAGREWAVAEQRARPAAAPGHEAYVPMPMLCRVRGICLRRAGTDVAYGATRAPLGGSCYQCSIASALRWYCPLPPSLPSSLSCLSPLSPVSYTHLRAHETEADL
eukprot:3187691-Rhodomonas_salina.2